MENIAHHVPAKSARFKTFKQKILDICKIGNIVVVDERTYKWIGKEVQYPRK